MDTARLLSAAIDAVAWELLSDSLDTADRSPSAESLASARVDAQRLLPALMVQLIMERGASGVERIAHERTRQIADEGYGEAEDRGRAHQLRDAALCYLRAVPDEDGQYAYPEGLWPWPMRYWKPATTERNLEKAGALIAATLDSLATEERGA